MGDPCDLPPPTALPAVRPDPAQAAARELPRVRRGAWWTGLALGALAAVGPGATGDPRAAWLPGVPAIGVSLFAGLAGRPERCRVMLVLAAACCATLAVATGGALARLAELTSSTAVAWQLGVFVCVMSFLLASWPAFRRAEAARREAEAVRHLYEELP